MSSACGIQGKQSLNMITLPRVPEILKGLSVFLTILSRQWLNDSLIVFVNIKNRNSCPIASYFYTNTLSLV